MLKINFDAIELEKIRDICLTHPHPFARIKAHVLLLKAKNIPHHLIAEICDLNENTVRNYLNRYVEKGIESLTEIPFHKPQSKLVQFKEVIQKYFTDTPPATINQACAELEPLIGFKIGPTQLRKYLKSIGVKHRKVGSIPAKVDKEKQQEFHDQVLLPKLVEAKNEKRAVYFVDAAHFVLGAFLAYLWSFKRIFVRTPSGRQRFNVLGALNAVTKEIISVKNDSYITSIKVCELFRKLKEQTQLPITIILDNAKYQKCLLVQNLALELDIELLYLPPYSPNLNLIERSWKFVKKNCLNSRYYKDFKTFRESISELVDNAHLTHLDQLNSLLTLKFHLFPEEKIKNAA